MFNFNFMNLRCNFTQQNESNSFVNKKERQLKTLESEIPTRKDEHSHVNCTACNHKNKEHIINQEEMVNKHSSSKCCCTKDSSSVQNSSMQDHKESAIKRNQKNIKTKSDKIRRSKGDTVKSITNLNDNPMDKVKEDFKNILSQCELLDLDASSLDDSFELEDTIQETADNSDMLYWYCEDLDEHLDAVPDTKKKVQDKLGNLMGLAEGIRDIADSLQNEFDDFPEKVDTFQKKIPDMKSATESLFKELFPEEELLLTKSKADNLKCLKQLNFHSPEVIKKETNKNDFGTPTNYPKQIPTFKTLEKIIMNSDFNENKRNEILWFYMTYFEQKKIMDEKDFDNNEIFISKKQKNLFSQMLIILEKYKEDEIFSLYYQILVTEIDRFINLEVKP